MRSQAAHTARAAYLFFLMGIPRENKVLRQAHSGIAFKGT